MTTETYAERLKRISKDVRKGWSEDKNWGFNTEDMMFLLHQAEQVQELEAEVVRHKKEKYRAMKQNQSLRKALEFYADKERYELWQERDGTPLTNEWTNDVTYDGGFTARTALNAQEDSK